MRGFQWIVMDVHSSTCQRLAATPGGRVRERWWTVATCLPALVEVIRSVPRPRAVVMEVRSAGGLAIWGLG